MEEVDILMLHRDISRRRFDSRIVVCQTDCTLDGQQEALLMTMESHLVELEKRHQALERQIEDALAHPGTDGLELTELKRRKLLLKDEIARLKDEVVH